MGKIASRMRGDGRTNEITIGPYLGYRQATGEQSMEIKIRPKASYRVVKDSFVLLATPTHPHRDITLSHPSLRNLCQVLLEQQ